MLGPQGSGKGTQAKRIADERGLPHVSTGEMFRALDDATPLGREVNAIMERGDLVPDELTIRMIRERLAQDDARDGFILDGFPRNLAQAEALDEMLDEIGRTLDVIFFFDLDDETAMERALGRAARGGPDRRHAGVDRAPARRLPRADRAGRRALPRDRQARAAARQPLASRTSPPRSRALSIPLDDAA